MGKCLQCGMETKNKYDYYTAVPAPLQRKESIIRDGVLWCGFQSYDEYLCSKHQKKALIKNLLYILIGLGAFVFFIFIIPDKTDQKSLIFMGIVCALIVLVNLKGLLQKIINIKTDAPYNPVAGSYKLVKSLRIKRHEEYYFTPSSYKQLKNDHRVMGY